MAMAATHPARRGTFACTSRKVALAGKSAFVLECAPGTGQNRVPGVVILKLCWAEIAERRV